MFIDRIKIEGWQRKTPPNCECPFVVHRLAGRAECFAFRKEDHDAGTIFIPL